MGRTQVPKGQDNLGKDTKDMEVARMYEQHLGISESRRHAALPLYHCFLLFLPEVPGNTGMGTRWVPERKCPCEDRQSTSLSFQGSMMWECHINLLISLAEQ